MPSTHHESTHGKVRAMYNALTILANRRSPGASSDAKLGRLLRHFGPVAEPIQQARGRIALDLIGDQDVASLSPLQQQLLQAKIGTAQTAFDNEPVDVALPSNHLIRESDLPQPQKGEEGWRNAEGIGAILADLGPLFVFDEADEHEAAAA